MIYQKEPKNLGIIETPVSEYFSYTYLPIKLAGQHELTIEPRLKIFDKIIGRCACDFVGDFGLDRFIDSYVYLTAKHQYQRAGQGFNRPGWHSMGLGQTTFPTFGTITNQRFLIGADSIYRMTISYPCSK